MAYVLGDHLDACIEPFATEKPYGEDIRYDDTYEWVRLEIGKLSVPEKGEKADWPGVKERCLEILAWRSKDLNVAAYLTLALVTIDGWGGLADGLEIFNRLASDSWDEVFPPAKRPRSRRLLLDWLALRLEPALAERTVVGSDREAREDVIAGLRTLDALCRNHFPDAGFTFRELLRGAARRRAPGFVLNGRFATRKVNQQNEVVSAADSGGPGGVSGFETWLHEGFQSHWPEAGGGLAAAVPEHGLVVQTTGEDGKPEVVICRLWERRFGGAAPEYAFLTEGDSSTLEGLYLLNQICGPIRWNELKCSDGPEIVGDLAELLGGATVGDLATSLYREQAGELWPRLVAWLQENRDPLAVKLPAPTLASGRLPQWLDVQWEGGKKWNEAHPPVLLAMIWAALIAGLGKGDEPSVLVPLAGSAEVTVVSRELVPEDVLLLSGDPQQCAAVQDLRTVIPGDLGPTDHPAADLDTLLASVLFGG